MDVRENENAALDRAVSRVDELVTKIRQHGGDLAPAFEVLEESLLDLETSGYPLETILPSTSEGTLGFSSIQETDGRGFWVRYSRLIKSDLCEPKGELHKLAKSGLAGATGAIVTAVISALGLSGAAIPVIVPVAAILITKGVEAFCKEGEASSNEP